MGYVAIKDCTFKATMGDESGTGKFVIKEGLSTKSKAVDKQVCLKGLKVQGVDMSGSNGTQTEPVLFTFSSATASKSSFDSLPPLLVNDVSASAFVTFEQGSSSTTIPVTIQITDAGQDKVQAI